MSGIRRNCRRETQGQNPQPGTYATAVGCNRATGGLYEGFQTRPV